MLAVIRIRVDVGACSEARQAQAHLPAVSPPVANFKSPAVSGRVQEKLLHAREVLPRASAVSAVKRSAEFASKQQPGRTLRAVWTGDEIEQLRTLLMEQWDPIGVHHFSDDDEDRGSYWDEYDSYMPAILSELESCGDVERLARYLAQRRTMDMGLDDRPDLDRRAAEAIIAWNPRRRP